MRNLLQAGASTSLANTNGQLPVRKRTDCCWGTPSSLRLLAETSGRSTGGFEGVVGHRWPSLVGFEQLSASDLPLPTHHPTSSPLPTLSQVHFATQIGSLPVLQALAAHGSSLVAADASGQFAQGMGQVAVRKEVQLLPLHHMLCMLCPPSVQQAPSRVMQLVSPAPPPTCYLCFCRLHSPALCLPVWGAGSGPLAAVPRRPTRPGSPC